MRLINADAVLARMQSVMDMQDTYLPIHFMELVINEMPTIDPEKYGRWLWDDKRMSYYCAECLFYTNSNNIDVLDGTFKYCPRCGSKMRGFDNEDYD